MMMVMVRMKRKKYGFIVNRDTTLPPQIDSGVPLKQLTPIHLVEDGGGAWEDEEI